jgi:hypothetical protein
MTPEFEDRLDRAISVLIQEMKDGCNDCRDMPGDFLCKKHQDEALDLITNPRGSAELKELLKGKSSGGRQ